MTDRSVLAPRSTVRFLALAFVVVLIAAACNTSATIPASTASDPAETDTASSGTSDEDNASTSSENEPEPTAAAEATPEPDPTTAPAADGAAPDDEATDDATTPAPAADDAATDDGEATEAADESSDSTSSAGFASDDDFCRVARELDENDPFEDADLDPFSPEFFDAARELYDGLLAIAPDAISSDIELVRNELLAINEQLAAIDYDFTNPAFGEVMEALDGGSLDGAAVRIETYLGDVCGIDVDAVDEVEFDEPPALGLDDDALAGLSGIGPEEAAMLLGSLNLDPELQACLFEKLPELTASEDPAILTQEICGTTLLEIVSGIGG